MRNSSLRSPAKTWLKLPSLQRENSPFRLTIMTLFLGARASAFSIAVSPAPTTTIVSLVYSSGSFKVYCTLGKSSPGQPNLRMLPCNPMPKTTVREVIFVSSSQVISNGPVWLFSFWMAVTFLPY